MAGYSARQTSFTTGDTITAAHSNDEFNQVLAAFNATTGHTHDGTAGEGGPISTLRDADANNKVLVDLLKEAKANIPSKLLKMPWPYSFIISTNLSVPEFVLGENSFLYK